LYTQSGTYTSVNGCNTEILDLTITPSTSNTTVQSACDSYTWTVNNTNYTKAVRIHL
jgi:transglutaminase/protease-like cytokinesis protein 3